MAGKCRQSPVGHSAMRENQLDISIDTIRTYIRRIYEKLHVQSRTEAVAKYMRS